MKLDIKPSNKKILVVGNSHTGAIVAALDEETKPLIDVINLASFFDPENRRNKILYPEIADLFNPEYIFCSFGGSEHSVFGLLDAPVKFDFMTPTSNDVEPERRIVSYQMIHATLRKAMTNGLTRMEELNSFFDCPVAHICTPLPFFELSSNAKLPRVFHENLHLGISPASIRKKLHDIHSGITRKHSSSLDVGYLEVPPESSDDNGFLLEKFCSKDPTHANRDYGKLVIQQIREVANV